MAEATDSRLMCFVVVSVKAVLKIQPFGCQPLGRKSAAFLVAAVLRLPLWSAEWVRWAGLLASDSLGWLRYSSLQLMLVSVAVEVLRQHLTS